MKLLTRAACAAIFALAALPAQANLTDVPDKTTLEQSHLILPACVYDADKGGERQVVMPLVLIYPSRMPRNSLNFEKDAPALARKMVLQAGKNVLEKIAEKYDEFTPFMIEEKTADVERAMNNAVTAAFRMYGFPIQAISLAPVIAVDGYECGKINNHIDYNAAKNRFINGQKAPKNTRIDSPQQRP